MCGFVGFTGDAGADRRDVVARMAQRIVHRGPDDGGFFLDDSIALGFRRLSIIDLAAGAQPMFNEDNSIVCVYNGEIYNAAELRDELSARGHVFRTRCDTEVLLHGYEEYGTALAGMLRGMFAFVVWDSNHKTLYGGRDPFGIKPFYYSMLPGNRMLFGSEIKSFLEHPDFHPEMNPAALRPYLTLQYSATEETFFRGVFKLPPATWFTLSNGSLHTETYWDIDFTKKSTASFEELTHEIDTTVRESVAAHKISDVPVGSFLSGGVDSSYVTTVLHPEHTFSVGFSEDPRFDESLEAAELSKRLGIQNHRHILTAQECFDALGDIQYHMDEPQSNPSSIPLYFLARDARKEIKVVLSGEGADELYGGYEWYTDTAAQRRYKRIPAPLRYAAADVTRHLPYFKGHDFILRSTGRPEDWFLGQAEVYSVYEAPSFLKPAYRSGPSPFELARPWYEKAEAQGLSELEKKQYLDMHLWLPGDILLKADKMSLASSLELRVPYLDKVVAQQAASLRAADKVNEKDTKYIFRKAANLTLPDDWADRPKKGFPVPIRYWLREEPYASQVRTALSSDVAAEYFDVPKLMALMEGQQQGQNNGRRLWTAYTFLLWHKQFFGE